MVGMVGWWWRVGDARQVYFACVCCVLGSDGCVDGLQGAVSFLNHPWLGSESPGEQSCAISRAVYDEVRSDYLQFFFALRRDATG